VDYLFQSTNHKQIIIFKFCNKRCITLSIPQKKEVASHVWDEFMLILDIAIIIKPNDEKLLEIKSSQIINKTISNDGLIDIKTLAETPRFFPLLKFRLKPNKNYFKYDTCL
jgi:hypothetical protein